MTWVVSRANNRAWHIQLVTIAVNLILLQKNIRNLLVYVDVPIPPFYFFHKLPIPPGKAMKSNNRLTECKLSEMVQFLKNLMSEIGEQAIQVRIVGICF